MNNYRHSDQHLCKFLYISLTFDDGYMSHYDIARYLSAIGIRATFFVPTHLKGKYFLSSAPERIVEISNLGHEIGSHSCTHPNLLLLSPSKREYELSESRKWLRDLLGKEIWSFAYPYFLYNDKVLRDAHKFYPISRSRYLHVGRRKISLFKVHFLTRKNILSVLSNLLIKNTKDSALVVLHNMNFFQIVLLLSSLKVLTQMMFRQIRFITLSELAHVLAKTSLTFNEKWVHRKS